MNKPEVEGKVLSETTQQELEETAQQAAKEEEAAQAAPRITSYTHKFQEPFSWNGKQFEKLTFHFGGLTGQDCMAAEQEVNARGITLENVAERGRSLERTLKEAAYFSDRQFRITTPTGSHIYSTLDSASDQDRETIKRFMRQLENA